MGVSAARCERICVDVNHLYNLHHHLLLVLVACDDLARIFEQDLAQAASEDVYFSHLGLAEDEKGKLRPLVRRATNADTGQTAADVL